MNKKYLGLNEKKGEEPDDWLRKYFRMPRYIEEGRETFEALVPDRYKKKIEDKQ